MNPVNELLALLLPGDDNINGSDGNININNNISLINRQVIASRPLAPGDVIGPGIPSDYVLDPVEVLACHPMGIHAVRSVSVGEEAFDNKNNTNTSDTDQKKSCSDNDANESNEKLREEMAFWMTLAVMGREAEERRRQKNQSDQSDDRDETNGTSASETKRRKINNDTNTNTGNIDAEDDFNSSKDHEVVRQKQRQQEVIDAYLLSLPKEGPDPCCWSSHEKIQLLTGTPLLKQVENTLTKVQNEYNRVIVKALTMTNHADDGTENTDAQQTMQQQIIMPPFSIDGRGTFPSVLWARSMHISRSFPRSLIDEEGVWWVGQKSYVPPATITAQSEEAAAHCVSGGNNGSILSISLGGYKAPMITLRQRGGEHTDHQTLAELHHTAEPVAESKQSPPPPQPNTSDESLQPSNNMKRPGSNLGIMIPFYDMLDHKTGHPVQWESEATATPTSAASATKSCTNQQRRGRFMIRFRCAKPISKGSPIYNNYGPKGNGELLVTYGFATENNVMDSVEGIVLGLRVPSTNSGEADADNSIQEGEELQVHKARIELIQQHNMPHRFENDGSVLFLGPFSIMRKLSSLASNDEREGEDESYTKPDKAVEKTESNDDSRVIPDNLYTALSLIGMDNVEEGPVVSPDELEMLSDVLRKKLDGFGGAQGSRISPSLTTSKLNNHCVKSVEAYKNGQRELLQLALSELDALMPGGE